MAATKRSHSHKRENITRHKTSPYFTAASPLAVTVGVRGMAELLGLGLTACWKLIREGEVEHFHVGKRALIPVESIHALIARRISDEAIKRKSRGPNDRAKPGSAARPAAG